MTDAALLERLARIEEFMRHIDKVLVGPPPLEQRLTRLEATAPNAIELTAGVANNKTHVEIAAALQAERERSAGALRNTIALYTTIAGTIGGTVVAGLSLAAQAFM